MKLGAKIVCGFAAVLVLAALVGYFGWSGLSRVSAIVEKADGANDLIKTLQGARLAQKNYMETHDRSHVQEVDQAVDLLAAEADTLASSMNEQIDRDGVMAAKARVMDFQASFHDWVRLDRRQTELYGAMVKQAEAAEAQCRALLGDQAKQLEQARTSGAAFVADKLRKVASANELIERSASARLAQKSYMAELIPAYAEQEDAELKKIVSLCDQLHESMNEQVNRDQVAAAKAAALTYDKTFKAWVDYQQRKGRLAGGMDEAAAVFMKHVRALSDDQQGKLDAEIAAGCTSEKLRRRAWKVSHSNRVRILANLCRQHQRDYKLTGDAQFHRKQAEAVEEIRALSEKLIPRMDEQVNRDQVAAVRDAATLYGERFAEWVKLSDEQFQQYERLVAAAETFVDTCEALRADQKAQLAAAQSENEAFFDDKLWKSHAANRLLQTLNDVRIAQKNFMEAPAADHKQAEAAHIAAAIALCDEMGSKMELQRNRDQVNQAKASLQGFHASFTTWAELQDQKDARFATLVDEANAAISTCEGLAEVQEGKMASTIASSTWVIMTGAVAACVSGLALALLITRAITKPIRRVIRGLNVGAAETTSAASQVSSSSQSLAQGASEQAAAVEETTASAEQMSAMVKQNAANAEEARTLADSARREADQGAEAMGRMSSAIDDIKKSSDETAKIIKTIDEIAFQTNLLALNAAVEAARAGEAGKGFAVVAEEVRNLAQRSAQAARDTAELIEEAVKNADNGVAMSKEAAVSLDRIADGSRRVNDLVAEISSASGEQAEGIEQISKAIGQMDTVTQGNAANAEQSASAAEQLSAQAEELNGMIDELQRIVGGASSVVPAAKSAPGRPRMEKSDNTWHQISESADPDPEDLIPLGAESDASDF